MAAAVDDARGVVIRLEHIVRPSEQQQHKQQQQQQQRVPRMAWPGGKVVSNKGQARLRLVNRLLKRQELGQALTAEQSRLLEEWRDGKLHIEAAADDLKLEDDEGGEGTGRKRKRKAGDRAARGGGRQHSQRGKKARHEPPPGSKKRGKRQPPQQHRAATAAASAGSKRSAAARANDRGPVRKPGDPGSSVASLLNSGLSTSR